MCARVLRARACRGLALCEDILFNLNSAVSPGPPVSARTRESSGLGQVLMQMDAQNEDEGYNSLV